MSEISQEIVYFCIVLLGLKSITVGSDFSFFSCLKYGTKYLDWYSKRETFEEFTERTKEQ